MADKICVLYVDDEPDLLELGKLFLEDVGQFTVDTSTSAEESLSSPSLVSYDAIISDYQMPGMNGIVFLKEVRQRFAALPFILFTGRGREEVVIAAINNGADFYLQKGGDPTAQFAELVHKVRQAVSRRKSESEITSIFQAVPVGIAVVANRVLIRVNERLCTLTGYPREELEGKNTRFLYLDDEGYAAVGRMREQAYRDGAPEDVDVPWRRKDGTVIDVHITAAAIDRSNPGAPMTYSALDITRAKRDHKELRAAYEQLTATEEELRQQYEELAKNERMLRESKERLESFMDSATDAFTIWDAHLNLVDLNRKALSYLPPGTKKEDIIGTNYAKFIPGSHERGEYDRYRNVIKTGIPFSGTEMRPEPQSGRQWFTIKAFRVGDGLGISTTDISQVKTAEEELRAAYEHLKISKQTLREQYGEIARSEERLKKSEAEISTILRVAPVGIGHISADRVFLRVNDRFCAITGYSREELLGRNARFLYPDDDEYTRAGRFYTLGNREGSFDTTETRFLRKDKTLRDIRFFGTQVDPSRPAAGNIFITIDITEEKRARENLQAAYEKLHESGKK
ncbi:MAG: PAS domain S-box protein [Methanoregula sp.]|jgi:PAS domain S-box-containing protein|uniref:response regulator n=1 Tax=Methanoregula sp. TaxID=2052170 RepID=UPI0025DD48C5|nr:PAS domain S-box protein [Methanoregula sp.]MCK9630855.1 PAS domain S-box protein [Methanoregula sp.]